VVKIRSGANFLSYNACVVKIYNSFKSVLKTKIFSSTCFENALAYYNAGDEVVNLGVVVLAPGPFEIASMLMFLILIVKNLLKLHSKKLKKW
jgi:hypothetical protein